MQDYASPHVVNETISEIISTFRENSPLVQCLTNMVVSQITANVLLAAGAAPAMCDTPSESRAFAQIADGVLINAGTPNAEQYQGMREAIAGANDSNTPWVLDPVAAGALAERTAFYMEALDLGPAAIRGNASEIGVLAGSSAGGRGVDATDSVDSVVGPARVLAKRLNATVAVSGATDIIVSPQRISRVASGHPMMTKVIGTGCALGALVAGYLGSARKAGQDEHFAVVAAHVHASVAGFVAAEQYANKPGSYAAAWLDALFELEPLEMAQHAYIMTEAL